MSLPPQLQVTLEYLHSAFPEAIVSGPDGRWPGDLVRLFRVWWPGRDDRTHRLGVQADEWPEVDVLASALRERRAAEYIRDVGDASIHPSGFVPLES